MINEVNEGKRLERTEKYYKDILTEDVLKDRADIYARKIEEGEELQGEVLGYINFELSGEWYLVEMKQVEEIVPPRRISRVPRSHELILGMTNIRGNLRLIIDIKTLLGLPPSEMDDSSRIILVKIGEDITGFVVNQISRVLFLDSGRFQPPILSLSNIQAEFIKGIYKYDVHHLVWLNMERILAEVENRIS